MNKKKAVVCTILFSIVFFAVIVSTIFIKTFDGGRLFYIIGSFTTSMWMGDCVKKFYSWLMNIEV